MREALARKHHRQQALLRAVTQQQLSTQAELVRALRGAGYPATQATVSRDIVELGLVKVARDGAHAYAPPSAATPGGGTERLRRFCEDYPVEGALAANLVVLRSLPGTANALGAAGDLEAVQRKAIASGARKAIVQDAREIFVRYFVWPALQAGALYEDRYPLATALGRPLLAKLLVDAARAEGARFVAHGCTGKGNDQVRFDLAVGALAPDLTVIAPMRGGMNMTRDEEIDYAKKHGIPVEATKKSPYSVDVNLWGRSIETGVLEDPWVSPPADVYAWTVDPDEAPAPVEVSIGFRVGIPVSLDGRSVDPVELVEQLNGLAGAHGVGR